MEGNRIGIVGGGQLGRMLTEAAKPLGFEVMVLDPSPECPASQVGAHQIQGRLDDPKAIYTLATQSDVVTWEIEHINANALYTIPSDVEPSPRMLKVIQDKLAQKNFLRSQSIPVAEFINLQSADDYAHAQRQLGKEMLIKTRRGGFDGRGNLVANGHSWDEISKRFGKAELYAEEKVPFQKELAVIVARDKKGSAITYPVVETIHKDNICEMVLAPAPVRQIIHQDAEAIARETVRHLGGAGVFAIEMFLTDDDKLLVNEIAPRVHNSGHHTIEANATSQFEQHIRAITGWPLGSIEMRKPGAAMINILGKAVGPLVQDGLEKVAAISDAHAHIYGKDPRPARKIGHITVLAETINEARDLAIKAREGLTI